MSLSTAAPSSPSHQPETSGAGSLLIDPGAPFRLDLTAWALRRRPDNSVDRWDGDAYRRVLLFGEVPVPVSMTQNGPPDAPKLVVDLGRGITDQQTKDLAASALGRMFGLSVDLSGFAAIAAQDPLLGPLAVPMRGLKPPRFATVFEALVNAVACQQLSLTVGIHLLNRLTAEHGRAGSEVPDSLRAFPAPEQLASVQPCQLRRHGFSLAKARTIVEAAQQIVSGELDLEALEHLDDAAAVERLTRLRGIGRWSAEYVLLRGLGRLHIFPGDDVGAHNKLRRLFGIDAPLGYETVRQLVARWHPYAGLVYFHLLLDSLAAAGLVELEAGGPDRP
jgi:DNA-3-methyladenine glycosylase II